jgi:hypothetical protein
MHDPLHSVPHPGQTYLLQRRRPYLSLQRTDLDILLQRRVKNGDEKTGGASELVEVASPSILEGRADLVERSKTPRMRVRSEANKAS